MDNRRKQSTRREFLKLVGVTGVGLVAAACTTPPASAPAAPTVESAAPTAVLEAPAAKEAVSLNVWWGTSPTVKAEAGVFTQANPDISINLVDIGDTVYGNQKYLTAVAGGTGPDVAYQNRHTFSQFASRKLYLDVTELFAADGLKADDYYPVQFSEVNWQGKLYGLPQATDTRFLFWNKAHFKEVGLDPETPPVNWDELAAFAQKLTQKDGDKISRFGFLPWGVGNPYWIPFVCNAAPLIADEGRRIPSDSAEWVQALQWMVDFYEKYAGGAGTANAFLQGYQSSALDPFASGKLSMLINGNWSIGTYATLPDLDFGMAAYPVGPSAKGKSNISCGYSFAVDPHTKHVPEAWKFTRWITGPDGFRAEATAGAAEGAADWKRQQLPGDPVYVPSLAINKEAAKMLTDEFASKLPDKFRQDYTLAVDALNWTNGCGQTGLAAVEYYTEIDRAVQNAINKKATADQALKDATVKVQEALDAAWAKLG